jgi:hypothetical protein
VELVGSTLAAAGIALVVWVGLSLWPGLWMLVLWMAGVGLWTGARLYRVVPTAFPPAFWSNALVTTIILVGPAIEDSASGSAVLQASAVRVGLFVGVSLYAWAMVWALERWRASRTRALFFHRG